ncbi:hypothetical protein IMZ48_39575 [Candidatus Bathyarchaeota archaeon]|nr:hypothetical protein [Candidatus Bathyarchaeota archaeon]
MRIPPPPSPLSSKLRHTNTRPGRNTTLPHPDADLSPNASISAEDVDPSRTNHRSFLSIRNRRYRHTLAHGKISDSTPFSESLQRATTSASNGTGADEELSEMHVVMTPDGRISKDMSFEEARASFAAEREEVETKKGLIKRFMGK